MYVHPYTSDHIYYYIILYFIIIILGEHILIVIVYIVRSQVQLGNYELLLNFLVNLV